MVQVVNLSLTGILTLCVFLRQRKYSIVQACVKGTSFFAVAFYLDAIFTFIMEGIGGGEQAWWMQGMGILLPKGIMAAILLFGMAAGQSRDERDGWQYMDGLTIGINLFSVIPAACVSWYVGGNVGQASAFGMGYGAAWVLTFFLVVLLLYYFSCHGHRKKEQEKCRQYEEDARRHETDVYLESVEEHYQRTRELWHDLKNHITLLSLLLQEGKYEQMEDYLHIFARDVDALTLPMKSGNTVVDALLAEKMAKAGKEGIAFGLSLCDLSGLPMKANEICGLLGNLLDNALEANEKLMEGRFITVECEEREECYYIRVRNAAGGRMERGHSVEEEHSMEQEHSVEGGHSMEEEGFLRSGKSDMRNKVGHGLGLRSAERIVHGCGGELAVERTGNQFTVAARLLKGSQCDYPADR